MAQTRQHLDQEAPVGNGTASASKQAPLIWWRHRRFQGCQGRLHGSHIWTVSGFPMQHHPDTALAFAAGMQLAQLVKHGPGAMQFLDAYNAAFTDAMRMPCHRALSTLPPHYSLVREDGGPIYNPDDKCFFKMTCPDGKRGLTQMFFSDKQFYKRYCDAVALVEPMHLDADADLSFRMICRD